MEDHDAPRTDFREPTLEVVPDSLVRMKAVDVQQVHGPIVKLPERFIERGLEECREAAIEGIVMLSKVLEHFRPIGSRLEITSPGVYRVASRGDTQFLDGLAE